MNYQETGFRALYKNFAAFPLNDRFRKAMEGYPNVDDANCMLVYGYIDHEAGLTLEVLAAGIEREERFKFFDPSEDTRFFIRVGAVENEDFALFDDSDNSLSNRYSKKLEMLNTYDVDEEIEKTREMGFLDDCRHPHYPDDVQVYLMRDGLNPELCWSRIIGLGEHWIMGVLLNEPNQNFDYHQGEKIAFFVEKTEDEKIICYSDMNPSQLLKPEDLEDGSMLREAIAAFNAERTEQGLIQIMEILRDSFVWVPCNAVLGELDKKAFADLIDKADGNLDSLVGVELSNQDNIRMIPDILQNGDQFFFPAFITTEDMGEYGQQFSKVQKHFLEVIALARNNEKNVSGIVINAFTEPWVLDKEIFDLVEKMKSRLAQE